jgi:hypothetical protein
MESGSPNQVVMSLREEEASKLGLQASPSCLSVSACSGMVVIVVFIPHRGKASHDATVSVVMTLLARWRFTDCPA